MLSPRARAPERFRVVASASVDLSGQALWPPMLWIGGGQGAGKTTLSWSLSRAHDLPLHRIDSWSYDHRTRMPAGDSLGQQLAKGPEAAADAFESDSRLRLELVLDDIAERDLGKVPAIVEGPQLMPGFAARLPPGCGVWLLPDPARTQMTRNERLAKEETLAGRAAAGRARMALILQRDKILTSRIRESAARAGRPVIEVPPFPDWPVVAAAIGSALASALRSAPRLAPGGELSRQRRYENKAAERQGRLWMEDAGLTAMPGYAFGCECGESGCRATWTATPDEYRARVTTGCLIAHLRV